MGEQLIGLPRHCRTWMDEAHLLGMLIGSKLVGLINAAHRLLRAGPAHGWFVLTACACARI